MRKRSPMGLVLACSTMLSLFVTTPATGAPAELLDEAKGYADALRTAKSDAEAARAVGAILDRLNVSILADDYTGDPVGIYHFEIALVAEAFRKAKLTSVDELASMLANGGLKFGRPGLRTAATLDEPAGTAIEKALRDMRKKAESETDDPNGFFILLVDELGKRKERPFELLGKPEDLCADQAKGLTAFQKAELPPAEIYQSMAKDEADKQFADKIAQAQATGDDKTAARLKQLQASGIIGSLLSSPPKGSAQTGGRDGDKGGANPAFPGMPPALEQMMKPMLDEKAKAAGFSGYDEMMSKASGAAGRSLVPPAAGAAQDPGRDLVAAAEKLRQDQAAGADAQTTGKDAEEVFKQRRDMHRKTMNRLQIEAPAAVAQAREQTKNSGAEDAFEAVGGAALSYWYIQDSTRSLYDKADIEYRVVRTQQEVIRDEQEKAQSWKAGFPLPKTTSCLYLDSVQLLLVSVDLLGMDGGVKR